ncbi:MFS transporter [Palleronia abyssalis]|nr:MFS transporter [Palleronia abyssalis]
MPPVLLLAAAVGIVGANSLVLSPLAGTVAAGFGAATTAADVLTAIATYGAGTAISALFLAPLADRLGLARALHLALGLLALSLAASAAAPGVAGLSLAQAVAGLAAGICLPATYGLAAELSPAGQEAQTMGRVLTGWVLSLVFGVAASAVLADAVNWRLVYGIMAGLAAVLCVAARGLANRPRPGRAGAQLLKRPGVLPALANVASFMAAFYGLYAFLGAHMTERLGQSTTVAGTGALVYGVGFAAAMPLDRVVDRIGTGRIAPILFGALVCIYAGLAGVAGTLWLLLPVCFLWGVANHLGLTLIVGGLTRLAPDRRGAILGLYSATTYGAVFVVTLVYRPVFEAGGFAPLALLSGLCIVPALIRAWRTRGAP